MRSSLRLAPALLLLGAGTAPAAPSFGPEAFAAIGAGDIEVAVLEPARGSVGERELILSVDGGRTFPVRLTAEIGPGDPRVSWRVPALPTEHAVLALREGDDGQAEEIVALSAEFTILRTPGLPLEVLRFRDGEWRTREADAGSDSLPESSLRGAGPERCERLIPRSDAFEEPGHALPQPPHAYTAAVDAPALADVAGGSPPSRPFPLLLPLRE